MLEVKQLAKSLGQLRLADISFTVEAGDYLALLGPSGVGKTVLLELIAGLMKPDGGTILFNGTDITLAPPEQRNFAVVYQDCALFPHLTVAGNVAYGLARRGVKRHERQAKSAALAEMLEFTHLLDRHPATLSGGEQQRVALARALAIEPNLLLLDEPLSALDPNARRTLRGLLHRVHDEFRTPTIHITHEPNEALAVGHHIAVMLDGTIRQLAEPEAVFRRPSDPDVAEFLGMHNVFRVESVAEKSCQCSGLTIHASAATATTQHLWIAPEELLLSREPFDSSARNQFSATVQSWDHRDSLLDVHLDCGGATLTARITYASFEALNITAGQSLYVTFKSSAVHCF